MTNREKAELIEKICKGISLKEGRRFDIPCKIISRINREMTTFDLKYKVKIAKHVLHNIYGLTKGELKVNKDLTVDNNILHLKNGYIRKKSTIKIIKK